MTGYEIPTEMRDFADRSVAQARKAFEGFMGAVHKASETVEGATGSVSSNAREATTKAVSFAEQNVTAAFDLASKMVHAKDVQEVLRLQTEYVQAQMAAIQSQAKEIGSAVQKAAGFPK